MTPKSSSKKAKKEKKEKRDKRTTSAPKRGEYRCGKCGYFPKKEKHDCAEECAKREESMAINFPKMIQQMTSNHMGAMADPVLSMLAAGHGHLTHPSQSS